MKTRALMFALATTALVGGITPAHGGYVTYAGAVCQKYPDGSGYCVGTFKSFRESYDPNARVDFYFNQSGTATFSATMNGEYHACTFPSTPATGFQFASAVGANQYFAVQWNANATCYWSYARSGSSY